MSNFASMGALAVQTLDKEVLGPAEKAEVIDALYKLFSLQKVVEKTGYSLRLIMEAVDEDQEFARAMNIAERHLAVIGEDELKRRAIHGVDSVVVANGRVVYQVQNGERKPMIETKYSDSLLKTYLEANRRDKYGAKLEVTTTHRGHIAIPQLPPELLMILLAQQRGEKLEFIVDDTMAADSTPEVMDGEFEEMGDQEDTSSTVTVAASDDRSADEFDIL